MTQEEKDKLLELVKELSDGESRLLLTSLLIQRFDSNLSAIELVIEHAKELFEGMSI